MPFAYTSKRSRDSQMWKFFLLTVPVWLCTLVMAQTPAVVSFDAPDAGKSQYQGTTPISISQNGLITGWYLDSASLSHGFIRLGNGQITEFDPPNLTGTFPNSINQSAQIVGTAERVQGGNGVTQGFMRTAFGHFVGINAPGAHDTDPVAINDAGNIAGAYDDAGSVWHGFLRDSGGTYTLFDAPNAGTGRGQGTFPLAMNANNEITGVYYDASSVGHGFVRDAFGNVSEFDAFGMLTEPLSINLNGMVTGEYFDANSAAHSFLRDATGNITNADMPGAVQTIASSINDQNVIVGEFTDSKGAFFGFRRDASGKFSRVSGPLPNSGAIADSVNNAGRVTGTYVDANHNNHGFIQ